MLRAALALLVLAGAATAQAQDSPPACDREVEVREATDWWNADRFSVRWLHWFPDRASLSVSAYTYDAHYRHHLEAEGPFSEWSSNSVIVSPKTMRTRGKLWAQLAADGRSLPPEEVSRSSGFYGIASFKAHIVKDLIGDAPELTITFFDRKQAVVDRYTIPRATIEAATARMMSVYADYRAGLAEPPTPCPPEIVLVH